MNVLIENYFPNSFSHQKDGTVNEVCFHKLEFYFVMEVIVNRDHNKGGKALRAQ